MSTLKRRHRRTPMDTEVDMTPMLDIVFIMLIFFIVTAVFLDEKGLDFTQAPEGPTPTHSAKAITVYVYANGTASVDGKITDIFAIPSHVQGIRALTPEAAVLLRAHPNAKLEQIVFLEDAFLTHAVPTSFKVDHK